MEKIKIGITQGDINGIGYETVLKAFSDPTMLELCTPIIYGSAKVATFYRKLLDVTVNFNEVVSASYADENTVNIVNCCGDEVKADPSVASTEAANAAWESIETAVSEYTDNLTDAVVMLPVNYQQMKLAGLDFSGNLDYLEKVVSLQGHGLQMLVMDDLRIGIAVPGMPIKDVPAALTEELVSERIRTLNDTLKIDFCLDAPRIAVMALNSGPDGQEAPGAEESAAIIPAIDKAVADGIVCYGPYTADYLMDAGNFSHFDAVLAMCYDQAVGFFKAIALDEGVAFCAGLPIVSTAPAQGVCYDKVATGEDVSEAAFCHAVYLATDIVRNRERYREASANKLRKQYNNNRRDDSDKLKQLSAPDEDDL